jgi:hypothetical protein
VKTTITLSLAEPAYERCLRVLGAWWCLGSSALQPRLLAQYEAPATSQNPQWVR